MHRYRAQIRRYRVETRSRVRSHRRIEVLAILCLAALAGGAAVTVPSLLRQLPDSAELAERLYPRAFVLEGVPASLEPSFAAVLEGASGGPGARAAQLRSRFPIVRSVRAGRDWFARRVRFKVELRRPVARVVRGGQPQGYLSAEGEVFTAPEGLFPEVRPDVELGAADAAERRRLGKCVEALAGPEALAASLVKMAWDPRQEGWRASLEDGTTVLWGDLRWSAAKAARLKQVLEDARGAAEGALTADLRYFEDGKIFVRPSLQAEL